MDFRQRFRQRFSQRSEVPTHPSLRWLGRRLHDPNLWHLGRRSVAGGCALGFFIAFLPVPIHMLLIPPLAVALRVNLPIALASIWITNPVTLVPIFFFAYKLGGWVTGTPGLPAGFEFHADIASITAAANQIWLPLFVGSSICAAGGGLVGYFGVQGLWRLQVLLRLHRRRRRRLTKAAS
ncbi:MAG: DUF2062 domain-containing protein [Gammaproteobacteria bacterium]|nr:DUF2062 domain-containing protein [Gammaproteobacteria bacterium]